MLFIVVGIVYLISFLCQWLWAFNWVKNSLRTTGLFISENAQFFEYLFIGAFLLYLLIIFGIGLYNCIRDGYQYAVKHDFFGRSKRLLNIIANIFLATIYVLFLLFLSTDGFKSCSGSHINYENYEHRADRL